MHILLCIPVSVLVSCTLSAIPIYTFQAFTCIQYVQKKLSRLILSHWYTEHTMHMGHQQDFLTVACRPSHLGGVESKMSSSMFSNINGWLEGLRSCTKVFIWSRESPYKRGMETESITGHQYHNIHHINIYTYSALFTVVMCYLANDHAGMPCTDYCTWQLYMCM